MAEICIVLTYKRPELLTLCLEAIRAAEPNIDIHVFADRGDDESAICDKFNAIHHLTVQHTYHGNSFNMLESLKWANTQNWSHCFIIEDDAIVAPDFFSWCRDALRDNPLAFAACGWQYSPDAPVADGPDIVIPWYLSVATCLPRHSLMPIIQHARPEYYRDMGGYLDGAYPASFHRGSKHYEQDGLVLRVAESMRRSCVWPRRPKAMHIGFFGYHAGENFLAGSYEDRLELIKLALEDPFVMRKLMNHEAIPAIAMCVECGRTLIVETKEYEATCAECFHKTYPERVRCSEYYYQCPG